MHCCIAMCGLIGPGYHGGAMLAWNVAKSALRQGHRVTLLSLFDTSSEGNPYLPWKEEQIRALHAMGIAVELVEYRYSDLRPSGIKDSIIRRIVEFVRPTVQRYFLWRKLQSQTESQLQRIKPDAIFCFHFDILSALYTTTIAPIIFYAGDPWHLPAYFRWKMKAPSFRKYFVDLPRYLIFAKAVKQCMFEMMRRCKKNAAVAAHDAAWFRKKRYGYNTSYFRIPVTDPLGGRWNVELVRVRKSKSKFRILFIGGLGGTTTNWALRFLVNELLPELEKRGIVDQFELHHVGVGKLADEFRSLASRPYIRMKGYVEDIGAEFLSADIVLEPTPIDLGIRTRIITAFSYGSCVITHQANTRGIPEILHENNALVANTGKGFADAILRVLQDERLRERLGANARSTFEQYFSEDKAAAHIVKEIEDVVNVEVGNLKIYRVV